MKRHEATIFDFTKDPDDMLMMTLHEHLDGGISIHCTDNGYAGFSMHITQGQAKDLIPKLQEGIIKFEVYKRRQTEEVKK